MNDMSRFLSMYNRPGMLRQPSPQPPNMLMFEDSGLGPSIRLIQAASTSTLTMLIGQFLPGRKRHMIWPEDVSPDRMAMFTIYCQPMKYVDEEIFPAFITTPEFPTRTAGKHALHPADEQGGLYLTCYRLGHPKFNTFMTGWKAFDEPAPTGRKIVLRSGRTYDIPTGHAIMLASGRVSTSTSQTENAPAIITGATKLTTITDAVFAEVWA